MIKTQIQLPDELYHKAKAVAKSRELSFAEVVRRGVEYITSVYLEDPSPSESWKPITVKNAGFKVDIDKVDLKALVDSEIRL